MLIKFVNSRKDMSNQGGRRYIYPGSFNPFHQGHARIADYASNILGVKVSLELSLVNPDKGEIDFPEMQRRLSSITDWHRRSSSYINQVVVTRCPFFADKIDLFSPVTFLLGVDTINRIFNPVYYADPDALELIEQKIRDTDTKFLVFNRLNVEMLNSLQHKDFIQYIPFEQCPDCGISSTEIRKKLQTH